MHDLEQLALWMRVIWDFSILYWPFGVAIKKISGSQRLHMIYCGLLTQLLEISYNNKTSRRLSAFKGLE